MNCILTKQEKHVISSYLSNRAYFTVIDQVNKAKAFTVFHADSKYFKQLENHYPIIW